MIIPPSNIMAASLKEVRINIPKMFNAHCHLMPALFHELRQRQPRIWPKAVHSKKRVRFANDDPDFILKPSAVTIAIYSENNPPWRIQVKTRAEFFKDETMRLLKRAKKPWRPRPRKITKKDRSKGRNTN